MDEQNNAADMALLSTINQALGAAAHRAPIDMEPARYAITGRACGAGLTMADDFGSSDMEPLDAPEYTPRGSSVSVSNVVRKGVPYCSTSILMSDRITWRKA